jgi:hypothetical protein
VELAVAAFAIASLAYAVATAPALGYDIALFQQGGRNWANGSHSFEAGPSHLYPPFALPLFWVATLVSTKALTVIWLLVNLVAGASVVYLSARLLGDSWPRRTLLILGAFLLSLAPFRVTLRSGQMSLVITALLLAALLARRKGLWLAGGLLIGLSLIKYTIAGPFFLYMLWKREWKISAVAVGLLTALTLVASSHMGISPFEAIARSVRSAAGVYTSAPDAFAGATGLKALVFSLTGDAHVTNIIRIGLIVIALVAMAVIFARTPGQEALHYAALSLFALWFAYHGIYDAVLCVIPAAVFINILASERHVMLGRIGVISLGLLALSIPGLLTERLRFDPVSLAAKPAGWLALQIERLVVFGLFWMLLVLLVRIAGESDNGRVHKAGLGVGRQLPSEATRR